MKFKKGMYLKVPGRYYMPGEHLNINKEQYDAIVNWIKTKSIANYANLCIHCFYIHGILHIPYKFIKIMWNTYINGFYKTIANNEIDDSED